MKINSIGFNSMENVYKQNNIRTKTSVEKKSDNIQISELGKYLNKVNSSNQEINLDKVNSIKNSIDAGTYSIDSKVLAEKIISKMKGEF